MSFYISTLCVYFVIYALGALSLNFQFGVGGIVNFAFIIFEAIGAYVAAITSLGSPHGALAFGQRFLWGASWPFPLPLVAAGAAGGLLALVIGPATMRKMRRDYQAAATLAIALIANQVISNATGLFNGAAGLAGVPAPMSNLTASFTAYHWIYVVWAAILGLVGYVVMTRLSKSPFGRTVRAIRDDEDAAVAIGKNLLRTRLCVFVIGGVVAGVTGGLLVEFIGAWGPSAWGYAESFVILQAVILGGVGNERGALIGAFLVGIVLSEGPRLIPAIGYPGLIDSLEWIVIGGIYLIVLWFRPQGLLPERPALSLTGRARRDADESATSSSAPDHDRSWA
jgi:branched-chain amino acid transport system permease protein